MLTPRNPDFNLLDDAPPRTWTGDWVSRRLVEGFKTLRQLPLKRAVLGFKNSYWRVEYAYEWQDLLAQAEGEAEALQETQREQNRVKIQPSLLEVRRCEVVIGLPLYIVSRDHLLLAVNRVGWAYALERDSGWVATRFGGYAPTWLARYTEGCAAISDRLRAERVPVF